MGGSVPEGELGPEGPPELGGVDEPGADPEGPVPEGAEPGADVPEGAVSEESSAGSETEIGRASCRERVSSVV